MGGQRGGAADSLARPSLMREGELAGLKPVGTQAAPVHPAVLHEACGWLHGPFCPPPSQAQHALSFHPGCIRSALLLSWPSQAAHAIGSLARPGPRRHTPIPLRKPHLRASSCLCSWRPARPAPVQRFHNHSALLQRWQGLWSGQHARLRLGGPALPSGLCRPPAPQQRPHPRSVARLGGLVC